MLRHPEAVWSAMARLRDHAYRARKGGGVLLRPPHGVDERDAAEAALALLEQLARRILPGYVVGDYGLSWQRDLAFLQAYRALEPASDRSADRKFALCELMKLIDHVPGDTVEVGVFRGTSSWFICAATAASGRTHYAIDSYAGLSAPSDRDGKYWNAGDMAGSEAQVRARLAPFRAQVVRGWTPAVFDQLELSNVAFAHVDVDLYEPTLHSLAFLYPLLSPGGILVCDDYGFETCPGARRAVDEFMAEKSEPVVHLPTGQGLILKSR